MIVTIIFSKDSTEILETMDQSIYYAIGDVHGRDDLLGDLHASIQSHHKFFYADRSAVVIHIGDYVDGGANSVGVIDRLMRGLTEFSVVCLKGNHEALMLDCLDTDNRDVWHAWLSNGGETTLDSLGVSLRFGGYDPKILAEALGSARISWLRSLPLYHATDTHLFVHAGIVPGVPINEQLEKDMLWIRSRFLESNQDHGRLVIHGHTPTDEPDIRNNRIGIDTGATSNGKLTAIVLNDRETPKFLYANGPRGKGH